MRLDQDSCYEISNISNLSHKTIFSHPTLIFTFADDYKDDVFAWAEVCAFIPLSGRPIAGQVFLNFKYFKEMATKNTLLISKHLSTRCITFLDLIQLFFPSSEFQKARILLDLYLRQ